MQEFVNGIFGFVRNLFNAITTYNQSFDSTTSTLWGNFLSKVLIDGTLINIPLTYRDLFLFVIPIVLIILFIIFVCKFIFKLIGMVKIW